MAFDKADPVGSVFAEVIGKPAWNVRRGHGSFLTFEFGAPHLAIREPIVSHSANAKVRAMLAKRQSSVRGQWHLWIYCCDWIASTNGGELARNESDNAAIAAAMSVLDGQVLTAVDVESARGAARFSFDRGGQLTTSPYCGSDAADQWMLYTPSGYVLTLGGNGSYCWGSGDQRPDEDTWLPLPPRS